MIDYEKLKEAHELAEKLDCPKLVIESRLSDGEICYMLYWFENIPMDYCTYNIDKLLTKLRELTQPQPKYKTGDKVYYLPSNDTITAAEIAEPFAPSTYKVTEGYVLYEKYLYPTKEDLIQAQIDYWQKMKEENNE